MFLSRGHVVVVERTHMLCHPGVRWTNVFTCTSVVAKVYLRQLEDKHLF